MLNMLNACVYIHIAQLENTTEFKIKQIENSYLRDEAVKVGVGGTLNVK